VQNVVQSPLYGSAFSNSGGPARGAFMGTGVQHVQRWGDQRNAYLFAHLYHRGARRDQHYRNVAHQTDYGTNVSCSVGIQVATG